MIEALEQQLSSAGLVIAPKSPEQLRKTIDESGILLESAKRYLKCLQAIRVEQLDDAAILRRLTKHKINSSEDYHALLVNIVKAYEQELKQQEAIDFDDMISKAADIVEQGRYQPRWTHVLVDEFQDISAARMNLLSHIINKGDSPTLTAVGDDWQSIYRFSGGKLELTTRFEEYLGASTLTKLQKTFRYNNSIADTAGMFVMKNPEQFSKQVVTHTQVTQSQVYLMDSHVEGKDNQTLKTQQVVNKIRANDANGRIAIMARYRYLLENARKPLFGDKNIHYWTFHGAKGLEADYCILIGFSQGKLGFPSLNQEDELVEALLPGLDDFAHSEERRLLYVAITRSKKKCYLIADPMASSVFINELLSPEYNVHIASTLFAERYKETYKCSECSCGYYKLNIGKYGQYYACSTGWTCRAKPRVCSECGCPSVDGEQSSICRNPDCSHELKICPNCGRPMKLRNSRYGPFWGCSGYYAVDDQCEHTEKVAEEKVA